MKLLFALLFTVSIAQAQNIHIIPQPVSVQKGAGQFIITRNTVLIATDEADKKTAEYFNDYLKQLTGFTLSIGKQQEKILSG